MKFTRSELKRLRDACYYAERESLWMLAATDERTPADYRGVVTRDAKAFHRLVVRIDEALQASNRSDLMGFREGDAR